MIKESIRNFGETKVPVCTLASEIMDRTIFMKASAGTNGKQGGDAGHGNITYFGFRVSGDSNTFCVVTHGSKGMREDECHSFDVVTRGDWELDCMIEGLEFIVETLKKQRNRAEARRACN